MLLLHPGRSPHLTWRHLCSPPLLFCAVPFVAFCAFFLAPLLLPLPLAPLLLLLLLPQGVTYLPAEEQRPLLDLLCRWTVAFRWAPV